MGKQQTIPLPKVTQRKWWRGGKRCEIFSHLVSGGQDVPIPTFPVRVQLTLLSNPCLFLTQIAPRLPGKQREIQRHPQHSPVGTETHPCLRGRVGKEGNSVACREALQPLLGDVINSFWDVGRLV